MLNPEEGLQYGENLVKLVDNPFTSSYNDKSPIKDGITSVVDAIGNAAEKLRMDGKGSEDPYYSDSKKNK